MRRLLFLLAAVATAALFVPGGSVSAQEGETVTSGVIVGVDTGGGEELVRFALSDQGGNITDVRFGARSPDLYEIVLDIEVDDLDHLERVLAGLRATPVVTQVERSQE